MTGDVGAPSQMVRGLCYYVQREVYKPPVRGGVPDAPPSVDGRRRFRADTFPLTP